MKALPSSSIKENACSVKSITSNLSCHIPGSMIHHKSPILPSKIIVSYKSIQRGDTYGVSKEYRVLSPQLLLKRFDQVRDCLTDILGLTASQREVVLRLLRLWSFYGSVYPKEAMITNDPGCSKATFWRTIKYLKQLNILTIVNRYVIRPHAQISNLYRLDKLLIIIARYLAEHGTRFFEEWLKPILTMPGRQFWSQLWESEVKGADP